MMHICNTKCCAFNRDCSVSASKQNISAKSSADSSCKCCMLCHVLHYSCTRTQLSESTHGYGTHLCPSPVCCRDSYAAWECYQAWLSMMKACRLRGPAGKMPLAVCGNNARMAINVIVQGMNCKDEAVTAEAELLLREALLVKPMCSCLLSAVHSLRP